MIKLWRTARDGVRCWWQGHKPMLYKGKLVCWRCGRWVG